MVKKYMKSAILGLSMLAIGGIANAAIVQINMYGASAEYNYWTVADQNWLTQAGCNALDVYEAKTSPNGIAVCNHAGADNVIPAGSQHAGAPNLGIGGNTVILRYSSKASYDGVEAIQNKNDFGTPGCAANNQRLMADEAQSNWATNAVNGTKCVTVNVAASDVHAETFNQESHGALNGPAGGAQTDRIVSGLSVDVGAGPLQFTNVSPLVVPFSFFKNSTLPTISNMSRLMATQIFAGQVTNWNQLDTTMASTPIVVCMRHAGSGTVATLDAAVMRGDYSLVNTEVLVTDPLYLAGLAPETYFNDGTGQMMPCISGKAGAIGYADSDRTDAGCTRITYQGVVGDRAHIKEGQYDFWSGQELYWQNNLPAATLALINNIIAYVSNPANLPASETNWWATASEMGVAKSTDTQYPFRQ